MIMRIERQWAKYPGWLAEQSYQHQTQLIAEYRSQFTKAPSKDTDKHAAMKSAINKYQQRDTMG